jgi:hypothetical protein
MGEMQNIQKILVRNLKGKITRDLGSDRRITLKRILTKQHKRLYSRFNWLKTGSCKQGNRTS